MEELTLQHKSLLHERLKQSGTCLSQYSFANIYLFRQAHGYRLVRAAEGLYISGRSHDGKCYLMPTTGIGPGNAAELAALARDYDFIFPVPEEWLAALGPYQDGADFSEADSDYMYTVEKIATYKGQKMHGKKNLVNQFLRTYAPRPRPLTAGLMDDAREILESWQAHAAEPAGETDYYPCREAFDLYDELVLCGGIYYVEDEPAGFIIGEELRENCFVLHFAKGKKKFKGLYQYMYNHFAQTLPPKYRLLNFEEDMGKEALKLVKRSYHPDCMLKKYRVRVKGRTAE